MNTAKEVTQLNSSNSKNGEADTKREPHQEYFPSPITGKNSVFLEVLGESMDPLYPPGTFLTCEEVSSIDSLIAERAYIFNYWQRVVGCKTISRYAVKVFQGVVDGLIQLRAINPDYNPVEPIAVTDLISLHSPEWRYVKENHE